MRTLSTLLALGFTLSLGACGGDDGDKFGDIADEVCACKDEACLEKANDKWDKLEREMRDKYKDKEPSESVKKKYQAAEDKAEKCAEALEKKD
jgi:hypothetical protein